MGVGKCILVRQPLGGLGKQGGRRVVLAHYAPWPGNLTAWQSCGPTLYSDVSAHVVGCGYERTGRPIDDRATSSCFAAATTCLLCCAACACCLPMSASAASSPGRRPCSTPQGHDVGKNVTPAKICTFQDPTGRGRRVGQTGKTAHDASHHRRRPDL